MSLFGTLNTGVSGMAAQANYLSTIGANIANSSTTGYKSADSYFETMLGNQTPATYNSGGVQTITRYSIADQGTITATNSVTDLAVNGNGFFVVQGTDGSTDLTRAGSFVPDANGKLVNTAGFKLMGYPLSTDANGVTTSIGDLQAIQLPTGGLTASASQSGSMSFNVPSNATAITGDTPDANGIDSSYTAKTSITTYDNLGNAVNLDVYLTKTGDGSWQSTVYNQADAAKGGGFPYSSGPLSSQALSFSDTTGALTSVDGSTSPLDLSVPIPNGNTVKIDLSQSTQLAATFSVAKTSIDGNAPSAISKIAIGTDGTLTAVYANGQSKALFRIPLADVPSENGLSVINGNAYQVTAASGAMTIGTAGTSALGQIDSSSLENSDVDLATQLTDMISAQRSYEANSKVIQASSDLLKIVDQLNG